MKLSRYLLFFLLFLSHWSIAAQNNIPKDLKPWVPWVEKGHEAFRCPYINLSDYDNPKSHICAWPSALTLTADDSHAIFNLDWQVIQTSWLPLPGGKKNWPQQVQINGQEQTVVTHDGRPSVRLPAGNYHLSGRFNWPSLPESLQIPNSYAFVEMTVNGKAIKYPKLEHGELWLSELKPVPTEQQSVSVQVMRKVNDGDFIWLSTRIQLDVSGKRREQAIGKVLPEGFYPIEVSGGISAFLDAEGILHAKLKPGNWTVVVNAYALPTTLQWQRPAVSHLWPQQEVWAFQSDERFRTGRIDGASAIDGKQAGLPESWRQYPAYLVTSKDRLSYEITRRGKSTQQENRLSLTRKLWLNFAGDSFTFVDQINGSMLENWRMSVLTPYQLSSGDDKDGPVLITSQQENERGLENRYRNVELTARGTITPQSNLPIGGWQSDFDSVDYELQLPPSYRLLAAFGAEKSHGTWLETWTIWNIFIILFTAILATRAAGIVSGFVTALTMVLIFQESLSPILLMVNLVLAVALAKYRPLPSLVPVLRWYLGLSLTAVSLAALLFISGELRTAIHPQLEHQNTQSSSLMALNEDRFAPGIRDDLAPQRDMETFEANAPTAQEAGLAKVERSVSYARFPKKPKIFERYQSDAVLQAGPGIPSWHWNYYKISWNSPVAKDQQVTLLIQPAWVTRLLKVIGVLLLLTWFYLLFKKEIKHLLVEAKGKAAVAAIASVMLMGPVGNDVQAADFPSQELLKQLQQRVLEAPKCTPQCASIGELTLSATADSLSMTMKVHVMSDTAIALPESQFWRPQQVMVADKPQTSLFRQNCWTYLPLSTGIWTVKLKGLAAPVEQLQLQFKDLPQRVIVKDVSDWDISGIVRNRLKGNALSMFAHQKQVQDDIETSRYAPVPLVRVNRRIKIDQVWTVTTTVERVAPARGAISVTVPLLAGERVTSSDKQIVDQHMQVDIPVGSRSVSWTGVVPSTSTLQHSATKDGTAIEHWQIVGSPSWHIDYSALPLILTRGEDEGFFVSNYYPYPGESLTLDIDRPKAIKGDMLAIDRVETMLEQGSQNAIYYVHFSYRATRGGEHVINLPTGYRLTDVTQDDIKLNPQNDQGKLSLPISPGTHRVSLEMRANTAPSAFLHLPEIALNAATSNIDMRIHLTKSRWVLWTQGPVVGPAVLYWSELVIFLVLALVLTRYRFSPLGTTSWLLLGFGLSLYSWWVLMLMIVWFGTLTLSRHRKAQMSNSIFNFTQIVLLLLSIAALWQLVSSIPATLLGNPDMSIAGNYSDGNTLKWFADQSDGTLPPVTAINISIWFYKGIMLLWVLWLSMSLLGWIKWAFEVYGEHGYWRKELPRNTEHNIPPDSAPEDNAPEVAETEEIPPEE